MNRLPHILSILTIALLCSGCGNRFWEDTKQTTVDTYEYVTDTDPTARSYHEEASIPLIEINHDAADVLYSHVGRKELEKKSPVYTTDFINQQDPRQQSIFGKVIVDQISERLVQRGVLITEGTPKAEAYFIPQGVDKDRYSSLTETHPDSLPARSAMLQGTYVIGDNYIYISAKIMRLNDNAVISGHNWTIPITNNIRQMLPQLKLDTGMEPTVKSSFNE